ncbi:penicillin-binding protein [Cytobacillus sp. AMY 15.2]|uniref:penicillin-binding protein n=1 Tax=Cytobacillus sp. AMY 15.2 TaxID=2939563 RepID=UPI00203A4AD5|nr:penicillin-binding protein [Cytobacillus sp. AMY 15.2]MCM3089488.1 penicillin-binding protein [Cytobacillus sp. AMY 15.2]
MKKQPNINLGAAILFLIFSLLFFVLIFRFVSIQATGEAAGHALAAKAQQKYEREKTIQAKRGTIYDRNGEVIAEDTISYKLVAILDKSMKPDYVKDPGKTAAALSKAIDLEESEIYRILTKKTKDGDKPFQVEFGKEGRDLPLKTKREIEDMKLPGITFITDSKRFYPNGVFASHLVGYVEKKKTKTNTTDTVGMLGLEQSLNKALTGKDGKFSYESDIWGYLLPNGDQKIQPAQNGKDVYLTIDKKIQTFLEDSMNKVDEEYKPKKMVAVVADAKTGEILAMGQRPSFHPKTKEGIEDTWHNEVIENSFEPGSTMKIFTLAAAIEEGKFDPNEWYKSGSYKVTENSPAIRDHNQGRGWGSITYLEGVQRSSNVAFAKIVKEKLGYEKYREYLTKFGFENPTGIDLPNETGGKIAYEWPLDKVTTGFGQGTAITPIQQIQAATAIANDGKMMQPHVISSIVNSDKNEVVNKTEPKVKGKPISAETAKKARDILGTVVSSENGTGYKRYNIEGYEVARKTGTAQIPDPNGGGYLTGHENFIFSFLGMAPKDDPELIIYVAVQQPDIDLSTNGAEPVAKIFTPVMKSSLQYLNIEPAKELKANSEQAPEVEGKTVEEAKAELKKSGFEAIVLGKGSKVQRQVPGNMYNLLEGERVILKTDGELTVPDMDGWSLRDVMKVAKIADLKLNTVGSGYVAKQNLKAGSALRKGDYLIVELEQPAEKYNKENDQSEVQQEEEEAVLD